MIKTDQQPAPWAARVVVFCPMRIERERIEGVLRQAGMGDVRVVQTGIGKAAVVRATEREAAEFRGPMPGLLFVLAGACGGLSMCSDAPPIARVVDEYGHSWTPWGADPEGTTLVGVDRIVSTPAEKSELAKRTGATIVDMESHAFGARCEQLGIAWTVVRGVSDSPEEHLPAEVMRWVTPEGETRNGRAAWDMLRRPSLVPHIVGVVRRSNRVLPMVGRRVAEIVRAFTASADHGRTVAMQVGAIR